MLTRAEVLVVPARAGRRRAAEGVLDRLRVDTYELPGDVAGQLTELRARTGLRMPDCCMLPVSYTHLTLPTNREV